MDASLILSIVGVLVAVVAAVVALRVNSRVDANKRTVEENRAHIAELREMIASQKEEIAAQQEEIASHELRAGVQPAPESGPAVVIYNPTKNADFDHLKSVLARAARDADLPDPIWLETTADDPGFGQTRKALDMGASVVIAAGGDGTVRNVGEVLTGTNTPLGLLPVGTGNILARNLDLPLSSTRRMAIIALTGKAASIDVGWLTIPEQGEPAADELPDDARIPGGEITLAKPGKHAFLVNAGIGFDAAIMAAADEESELKSKIGWLAYVKAAIPYLLAPKMNARIRTGESHHVDVEARSVMTLNCGQLLGGFVLDPHAQPDDGWLDLAVLDTRRGLIGWADLVRQVGLNGVGLKPITLPGVEQSGEIDVHRINGAQIEAQTIQPVQVDGDVLGFAREISTSIEEAALLVRVG
ncbi:diacylglycerol/lipid kinase family protein [Trueperella bialowiezensis]|uniref:Diacylglycerol kinase n=1 Tax=Trueperella bialowiezensis TaxID=312285 RepID=A0A448PE75_9ACTO|nr:diacylglycerol kinase family protein [Trueperella bialowiezensis]VEI13194.1 Diacylglycerol kinase [Trueperella bialowiezensis]